MTIDEIYSKYKILPSLALHQKRVAAVAWQICDSLTTQIDSESVVKACLIHDMGNIIKFDLTLYPELLEPQGLEYWQKVKAEFIEKYGNDEHIATFIIVDELKVDKRVEEIVKSIGFSKGPQNLKIDDYAKKIACYSDHRVSPFGVLPLKERISDGQKRFIKNKKQMNNHDKNKLEKFKELKDAMFALEEQIFTVSKIDASSVTNDTIVSYLQKIENFSL